MKYFSSLCTLFLIMALACGPRGNDLKKPSDPSGLIREPSSPTRFSKENNARISGFLYHRFNERKYPSTSIETSLFERHLRYIIDNNIPTKTLSEVIPVLQDPSDTSHYAVITIDDAFQSFYNHAFPILKAYEVQATLFVNTETVGSGDYMSWEELKEVSDFGIEIGNHTHSHDYFLNYPDSIRLDRFSGDIKKANQLFMINLDLKPEVFAYPYGEYDTLMKQKIAEMGFICGAAQHSGVISSFSDPYALPRFPMTDFYGRFELFTEKINMNALPVIQQKPESPIPGYNPPQLELIIKPELLDLSRLQCFIQGSECLILEKDIDTCLLRIQAKEKLVNRRHLYTITVPSSKTGQWYWFSHQWVFPDNP